MKITYDGEMYNIITEFPETEIHISTNDINEAKEIYLHMLSRVFDETVRLKFMEEYMNKIK